jgi:hypothetical protein
VKIDNRAYKRNLEKRGTYSNNYKKDYLKKNKYYLLIEIDAIVKEKYKLSKEEIDKYYKNKLYFKYKLLGYITSSY